MSFATTSREAWRADDSIGGWARATAKDAILALAGIRWEGRARRSGIRCFYSHAVFPDNVEAFEWFVQFLRNRGDIIDTAGLNALASSEIGRAGKKDRYFHLSFDDGFANVYETGGLILERNNIPYTLFIPTDLIEASEQRIAEYFRTMTSYRAPVRTMSWAQVTEAAASGLAEIGCHTRSHARLCEISNDEAALANEVGGAKAVIEAATGSACTAFAWPYGTRADIDATSLSAIREAGFSSCFSAVRGQVTPGETDMFFIPRHQVEFHWRPSALRAWANGFGE